jgi:Xaa-Pro aminopeptidase
MPVELSMNHLEKFKFAQKLAYDTILEVSRELLEGITEIEVAGILDDRLLRKGVKTFFHNSFAWFGDRTSFQGIIQPFQFLPSKRRLEKGMAVILDTAPAPGGYTGDVGYSFSFGDNPIVEQGKKDLQIFRDLILDGVRGEKPVSSIYKDVDVLMNELGYYNCHQKYPFSVLAHKIGKIQEWEFPFQFLGFSIPTYLYLLKETLEGIDPLLRDYVYKPYWNRKSKFICPPGLYAVEPHLGREDIGIKFEEILVVTDYDAFWLDDDLPHVRYWETV